MAQQEILSIRKSLNNIIDLTNILSPQVTPVLSSAINRAPYTLRIMSVTLFVGFNLCWQITASMEGTPRAFTIGIHQISVRNEQNTMQQILRLLQLGLFDKHDKHDLMVSLRVDHPIKRQANNSRITLV